MKQSKQIERGLHEETVEYGVSIPSPQLIQQAAYIYIGTSPLNICTF